MKLPGVTGYFPTWQIKCELITEDPALQKVVSFNFKYLDKPCCKWMSSHPEQALKLFVDEIKMQEEFRSF